METMSHDDIEQDNSSRREFLKKSLLTTAYVAPVIFSFSAKDLHADSHISGGGGDDDDGDDDD